MFDGPMIKGIFPLIKFHGIVKECLGIDNFFIAGGSVLDLSLHREYKDIDIYFESFDDLNIARDAISHFYDMSFKSDKAYSYNTSLGEVQLIRRNLGTPEEIFKTFDLNKSQSAVTSSGYIESASFKEELHFNMDNFSTKIMQRLFKYKDKGIELPESTIRNMFEFLVQNQDEQFTDYYKGIILVSGLKLISDFIIELRKHGCLSEYLHIVIETIDALGYKFLEIVNNLSQIWDVLKHPLIHAYLCTKMNEYETTKFPLRDTNIVESYKSLTQSVKDEARSLYPEMFI